MLLQCTLILHVEVINFDDSLASFLEASLALVFEIICPEKASDILVFLKMQVSLWLHRQETFKKLVLIGKKFFADFNLVSGPDALQLFLSLLNRVKVSSCGLLVFFFLLFTILV